MATHDVPRLHPDQLQARMAQGEPVVVLDVRTTDAISFQPDQIPGARSLPLAEVVQQATTLPRHGTIVTY